MPRLLVISLCSVLLLSACSPKTTPETTDVPEIDTVEVEQDVEVLGETSDTESTGDQTDQPASEAEIAKYVAYTETSIGDYAGSNKVIFFHAAWCPTCRALNEEITSRVSELPVGTVILKADYDQETDLRQKYNVGTQHTLVFIDDEGNSTKSNLIGVDFDTLQAQL